MANQLSFVIRRLCETNGLDAKYQQHIKEVLGSCAPFIRIMSDSDSVPMLAKSIGLACEIPESREDDEDRAPAPTYTLVASTSTDASTCARPSKIAFAIAAELYRAVNSIDSMSLGKFSRTHARTMGMAAVRVIDGLLQRVPCVGNVIEFAPHANLTVVRGILASSHIHYGSISEHIGNLPFGPRRTVGAKNVQTIVINARRLHTFIELYVGYVTAMIAKNLSIFAIIIHDGDTRVTCDKFSAMSREINARENVCVTVLSGNEKKITSVLDVFYA
jgi:hypothetical protein